MTDDRQDELQDLWQSEKGKIDMDMVLEAKASLETGRVLGRRLWNGFFAVFAVFTLIYIGLEWTGVLRSGGWLTVGLAVYWLFVILRTRQMRRRQPVIATLSQRDVLKHAIQRAKSNLWMARCMYGIVPGSGIAGYFVGMSFPGKIIDGERLAGIPVALDRAIITIIVCGLLASIVYGLKLAKEKHAELTDLRARLKEFEEGT